MQSRRISSAPEHYMESISSRMSRALCAMNLFLHGIGMDHRHPVIEIADSLEPTAGRVDPVDMVLTNPPFGKKSSFTIIGADGRRQTDKISYERPDFWATTSNKQLNFVQHVHSMLNDTGRAAVVVPDNVLFEGGAGEGIRRTLLQRCNVHTLLRLPTGIWYSPGVKANVLFFDKSPASKAPATKEIWVYDLRSGRKFSLRQNPIESEDLTDFVRCYNADNPTRRKETPHFRRFKYSEILARRQGESRYSVATRDARHHSWRNASRTDERDPQGSGGSNAGVRGCRGGNPAVVSITAPCVPPAFA